MTIKTLILLYTVFKILFQNIGISNFWLSLRLGKVVRTPGSEQDPRSDEQHPFSVITVCFMTNFKDVCTCYRLINTSILKKLKINGERFEYDFSMINQLTKITKNIGQTQIEYRNRSFSEGKKNTWIVGLYAIKRIILDRIIS